MVIMHICLVGLMLILISLLSIYLYYMIYIKNKKLIYDIDEKEEIKIKKDIVYKKVEGKDLLMDIYSPSNLESKEKLPVVIFVHGEGPELFIKDAKNWKIYCSYGRLVASMGFAAVTFNHRYAYGNFSRIKDVSYDVLDAVKYVRGNATRLNVDAEKICIWSFSLGGIYSSLFLKNNEINVKCLISYYGLLDIYTRVNEKNDIYNEFTPEIYLENFNRKDVYILIVKAAKDKIKGVNKSIDNFIEAAKKYNIKYEYIMHNTGGHSFDIMDDNCETRDIIGQTLKYIKEKMILN